MKVSKYTDLSIGDLAHRIGCKVETIRYYERAGLLKNPTRTGGNQRVYSEKAAQRLAFIRHARELGFTTKAVRELLHLSDNPNLACDEADVIASRQLEEVEARLKRLRALRKELKRMTTQCRGSIVAECRVIEVLSNHRLCAASTH